MIKTKIKGALNSSLSKILSKKMMGIDAYADMAKIVKSKNPMIFDIGANEGQTVTQFGKFFHQYQIHSFEPSPDTFKVLEENTSNNKNVHAWNYGVGSSTGTMVLNENERHKMSSFLELGERGWGKIAKKTSVDIVSIDDFLQKQGISNIDILKIDTQGFELEVLKGAKTSMQENKIGLLYFEVNFVEIYKDLPSFPQLFSFCTDNGFELVAIYPIKYNNSMATWTDVLFKHKSYNTNLD